jgi:hypothetical protein
MGIAIAQILMRLTIACAVLTLLAAPVMKIFVRELPLHKLAFISFWAIFRVLFVAAVVMVGIQFSHVDVPVGLDGLFVLIGMCAVGSLITYGLEQYGIPKRKFPGIGARTVFVLLILSWVIVGLWFLATKL